MPFPKANSAGASREFEQTPAGNHVARLYQLVDLGRQRRSWQGEEKIQHQILLAFELCHELMADGRPFSISATFTLSMHPKATLRRMIEGWRGASFSDEDAAEFDLETLLGRACMVQVTHRQGQAKTYANVQSIAALPKGMTAPEAANPLVVYSPESHDQTQYDRLPAWVKRRLDERVREDDQGAGFDDDEIPF